MTQVCSTLQCYGPSGQGFVEASELMVKDSSVINEIRQNYYSSAKTMPQSKKVAASWDVEPKDQMEGTSGITETLHW